MADKASVESYPSTAFILAVVAGALIVAGGIIAISSAYYGNPFDTRGPPRGFREQPHPPRNISGAILPPRNVSRPFLTRDPGYFNFRPLIFGGLAVSSLVSGIAVVASALMLKKRPKENTAWGILILVFSVLSFFGLGGFLVGAILGIVSGALVLGWNPKKEGSS